MLGALLYLHRLKTRFPTATVSSSHRLFIAAFMIASKVICDDTDSNRSWSVVAQKMFGLKGNQSDGAGIVRLPTMGNSVSKATNFPTFRPVSNLNVVPTWPTRPRHVPLGPLARSKELYEV